MQRAAHRAENGVGIVLIELAHSAEDPRVAEVDHRIELPKVVLQGRARKQHAALARERVQRLRSVRAWWVEVGAQGSEKDRRASTSASRVADASASLIAMSSSAELTWWRECEGVRA